MSVINSAIVCVINSAIVNNINMTTVNSINRHVMHVYTCLHIILEG